MSYDYFLYPRPPISFLGLVTTIFSRKMGKMMGMLNAMDGRPIGKRNDVQAKISSLFKKIEWEKTTLPNSINLPLSGISDWSWHTIGSPEIMLGMDSNENVRILSVSRAEYSEIKALAKALKLTIVDEQVFD